MCPGSACFGIRSSGNGKELWVRSRRQCRPCNIVAARRGFLLHDSGGSRRYGRGGGSGPDDGSLHHLPPRWLVVQAAAMSRGEKRSGALLALCRWQRQLGDGGRNEAEPSCNSGGDGGSGRDAPAGAAGAAGGSEDGGAGKATAAVKVPRGRASRAATKSPRRICGRRCRTPTVVASCLTQG